MATYLYDSYGSVTKKTGSAYNPFLFDGQYQDAESGLYYLQARYYDPATGQFMTVDPLVQKTKTPFVYAGDDPSNNEDPSGESFFSSLVRDTATVVGGNVGSVISLGYDDIAEPYDCLTEGLSSSGCRAAELQTGDDLIGAIPGIGVIASAPQINQYLNDAYNDFGDAVYDLASYVLSQTSRPPSSISSHSTPQSTTNFIGRIVNCNVLLMVAGFSTEARTTAHSRVMASDKCTGGTWQ